jgi:ketosteroid isomerase-like protein
MIHDTPRAIVQAFLDHGARGELAQCLALVAEDATWTNIGSTALSGTFAGKQQIVDDLLGPLFGRLENGIASKVGLIIAEGEHVVVLSEGRARTLDGQDYNNTYAQVFTVRDGSIVAVKEYMDTALVERVFGTL